MQTSKPTIGSWAIVVLLFSIAVLIGEHVALLFDRITPLDQWLLYRIGMAAAVVALLSAVVVSKKIYDMRKMVLDERGKVAVAPPPRPPLRGGEAGSEQAVLLLSLLQEKGRFVDYVMEDIAPYSNEQVGAAARVVHQGCREVIKECFDPLPVAGGKEKSEIVLDRAFNPTEYRLTGKVSGTGPYKGMLVHKGWRAGRVQLPRQVSPPKETAEPVIVPAEVTI